MGKKDSLGRRDFLKISAAGAAGIALTNVDQAFSALPSEMAWQTGMAINPNISNLKVVGCYDKGMVKSNPSTLNIANFTAAVDAQRVENNMDGMAMELAGKTNPAEAWSTIFQKPSTKQQWSDVNVAIKINTIARTCLANVSVIGKVCKELAKLGVQPKNIIIYDMTGGYTGGGRETIYPPYFNLTDTSKYAAVVATGPNKTEMGGGTVKVSVTTSDKTYNVDCVKNLANGVVDLLVNISVNKGHGTAGNGHFTLSMKNHYGTFTPEMHDDGGSGATGRYIFGINQHQAILGGTPPRQQLCIVDSLWAEINGNDGPADCSPCYLVMGTFGPAVDYATIKNIREPIMKASHTQSVVNAILPGFGYNNTTPDWKVIGATGAVHSVSRSVTSSVQLTLSNSMFKRSSVHLDLPVSGSARIHIFDLKGSSVREFDVNFSNGHAAALAWDGRAQNGRLVSTGHYVVRATAGNISEAGKIWVGRV